MLRFPFVCCAKCPLIASEPRDANSNKLPDFEGLSRRHQDLIARMETQAVLIESVEQEIHRLEVELRQARSDSDALRLSLAKAEHAAESRSLGWFRIRRCIDDIELLAREQQGCEELQARLAESQLRSEALKDGLAGHRKQHGKVLERLSTRFDAAIRTLAGKKASASVSLDGNGLQLRVLLGVSARPQPLNPSRSLLLTWR